MENIKRRVRNLLSLAERGATEGERNAARKQLDKILEKYNIHPEKISVQVKKGYDFTYKSEHEMKLLLQVVVYALGRAKM